MPYANKEDLYRSQIQRWIRRKQDAVAYMGGSCIRCGYSKYYGAFHFHHVDPKTKRWDWSKLRLRKWSDVLSELDRCILLCANCHAEEHQKI